MSPLSLVKPCNISDEELTIICDSIINTDVMCDWHNRCFRCDLCKDLKQRLIEHKSEYLVIDLADCRYPIFTCADEKIWLTKSKMFNTYEEEVCPHIVKKSKIDKALPTTSLSYNIIHCR